MLAGAGYLTLYPNYRGSIGRGVAFAKADHRDLMGKEFQDMLDGIDHLVAQGLADPNRVGIGGGSYGGYTSAWATTYRERSVQGGDSLDGHLELDQHDRARPTSSSRTRPCTGIS